MVNSMTAFASVAGEDSGTQWAWDIRGVNGRGLDVRVRVPDGCEALDQAVRKAVGAAVSRGTIYVNLKVQVGDVAAAAELNEAALAKAIEAAKQTEEQAAAAGLHLAPALPTDFLSLPGVMGQAAQKPVATQLWTKSAGAAVPSLVAEFLDARAAEGAALATILSGQIDKVVDLTGRAAKAAEARAPKQAETLKRNVAALLQSADGLDDARLTQELALLAVKSDVTEEIDRLGAHTDAARVLLATKGPIGRKFDFLMQEFNREANTLCSKSGDRDLTQIGLDLKTVIDQMREQVQNVE